MSDERILEQNQDGGNAESALGDHGSHAGPGPEQPHGPLKPGKADSGTKGADANGLDANDPGKAGPDRDSGPQDTPRDAPQTLLMEEDAFDPDGEFELPDGMELDRALMAEARPLFKELDLDRGQQQKLVTLYSEQVLKLEQQRMDQLYERQREWRDEIQRDPRHGEVLADAKRALDRFAGTGFASMVKGSWMGDNPEVIGFLSRIGHALRDDVPIRGGRMGAGPRRAEDVLFDDMFDN